MKATEQKVNRPKLSMSQAKECGRLLMVQFIELLRENVEFRDGQLQVASGAGKTVPVTVDKVKQDMPLDTYLRTIGSTGTVLYTVTVALRHLGPVAFHEDGMEDFDPPMWFDVQEKKNGEPYVTDWGFNAPETDQQAEKHRQWAEICYLPTNVRASRSERVYEWRGATKRYVS